jgi:hypothetical protein
MRSVTRRTRTLAVALLLLPAVVLTVARTAPAAPGSAAPARVGVGEVRQHVAHDVSPPLGRMRPLNHVPGAELDAEAGSDGSESPISISVDKVGVGGGTGSPATSTSFDGIPVTGCGGNAWVPPDPSAAAGLSEIVEVTNMDLAVYSKAGALLLGPECTGTLWSGFTNGCANTNNGDATVVWDSLAARWVVSVAAGGTTPVQCLAVSTGPSALGTWYRYAFPYSNGGPDYEKVGVWSDGYYVTGNTAHGPVVCAYDRSSMLIGQAASDQCFSTGSWSALPASIDGQLAPPSGEPEWLVDIGGPSWLNYWKVQINWAQPSSSQVTGPQAISVNAFSEACGGGFGSCAPQPGTTQLLETLSDRLMYRLAYRNLGTAESMVVTHTVSSGGSVGPRWYELRVNGSALVVNQQGTYQPDNSYRFMGSVAEDHSGNIGLGYTLSSSSTYPSVAYTGRLAIDPTGGMTLPEGIIQSGSASQVGTDRWGDYSEMSIDPVDDCTFWYVNEYLSTSGTFAWRTRIGEFSLPTCPVVPAR